MDHLHVLIAFVNYSNRPHQCSVPHEIPSDVNKMVDLKRHLQINWNKKQFKDEVIWNTETLNNSCLYQYNSREDSLVFMSDLEIERLDKISFIKSQSYYHQNSEYSLWFWFVWLQYLLVMTLTLSILKTSNLNEQKNMQLKTFFGTDSPNLQVLLDTIAIGVISTNTEFCITYMNVKAGKMCGWQPNKAAGKPFDDVVKLIRRNSVDSAVEIDLEDSTMKLISRGGRQTDVQRLDAPLISEGKVLGMVVSLQDMTESRNLVDTLKHEATHDALTGLPNRSNFNHRLHTTLDNGVEFNQQSVLVNVDLDGFKHINDSYGHAAGDALLIEIAKLMKSQVRCGDFIARLGGDEFAVILHDCDLDHGNYLMKRLVRKISEYEFCWENNIDFIGASAGITIVTGQESPNEVCDRADAACYEAKRRGKGQVCVFEYSDIKL